MIYLIGNPTRDKIRTRDDEVDTIGGTVWYAALLMVRLLRPVAVVGCGDALVKRRFEEQGVNVRHFSINGPVTHFENDYTGGERCQRAKCGIRLNIKAMPPEMFKAPALLVGPVLQETDPAILTASRKGLALLDAQGFLRYLTAGNRVVERMGPAAKTAICHCDILKVDAREARLITSTGNIDEALVRMHRMGPKISIITQGAEGARIYDGTRLIQVSAPKVTVVDSTGAGDVFAAAFLASYLDHSDPITAGRFAVAAATLSTRSFGASCLPSQRDIEQSIDRHFLHPDAVSVCTGPLFR